jgi:NAD+ synthase
VKTVTRPPSFSSASLRIDCGLEVARISKILKDALIGDFKKRGFVLGLSGGIDSSVVCALCVDAVGKEKVLGLLMPERESSEHTLRLSRLIAEHLGVATEYHDITGVLESIGCYKKRNEAIRRVIPEYTQEYTCKITLPNVFENPEYRVFSVTVESPDGFVKKKRLSMDSYLGVLSASNFKQRVRKMLEYYHADRLNYAVAGTPNRLEYDQGFFVKLGDGSADIKPIAHLYKTQVYQLGEYLGLPAEIRERQPTTDTYSMPQSQEEFYFSLPYQMMDLCMFGKDNNIPIEQVAAAVGLDVERVGTVFRDIEAKREATRYLHAPPVLVEGVRNLLE